MSTLLAAVLCGLFSGVLSAWGVGGGTLLLLCMTLLLQVEQQQAQLVNLLFFLPTAAAGLLFHGRNGYLSGRVWLRTAPPAILTALLAALAAERVDAGALRPLFGLLLLWGGGAMLWKNRRP